MENPFKWRHFAPDIILTCVRWYLRYALSFRDLEEMMTERGLSVDHTTIYRWVQICAPEPDRRSRPQLKPTNDSWRVDETYVKVRGQWMYLYRAADIRAVFNAPNRDEAEALLARLVQKYEKRASRLANWMETNISEGLTVFSFPATHQRRLRTANGLERLNREVRRRSRVAMLFPNEASCLRLVTAIVMEISDDWETGRIYLRLEKD